MSVNFKATFDKLESHYDNLFLKHKDRVESSQQSSRKTQEKRLSVLVDNVKFKEKDKILDFGCGTGYFLKYLIKRKGFKGFYCGIDISGKIIEYNKKKNKNKKVSFHKINILKTKFNKNFDYIFINGIFNNHTVNNWKWMKQILKVLIKKTNKALIFNNLSSYVDYKDRNLFYIDPKKVFDFSKKNLSKFIVLKHDYAIKKNVIPYEFTTFIIKKDSWKN